IAFRLFEFLLGEVSGGSAIDRVRGPLGLLVAAGLVAGYHFALWRRDRALLAAAGPAPRRTVDHVTLVAGPGSDALAQEIAKVTGGAKVTVWLRADDGSAAAPQPVASPASGESAWQVAKALEGITARHVLVVLGPDARVDVIPVDTSGH
ncbi:MAG TPA: hypothetical protein VD841_03585, partial [Arthrobacter sp.]|nr:hypothetical protein [Arthrobacter sp.]